MKWIFQILHHRFFRHTPANAEEEHTADAHTGSLTPSPVPEAPEDDATMLFAARSSELYLDAVAHVEASEPLVSRDEMPERRSVSVPHPGDEAGQLPELEDDATALFAAHSSKLYLEATDKEQESTPVAENDATVRTTIHPADNDATTLMGPYSVSQLYTRAIARTDPPVTGQSEPLQATSAEAKQPESVQPATQDQLLAARTGLKRAPGTPRKRSRRHILSAVHLVVDGILLLMLAFVSLATYQQNVNARELPNIQQVQQQANQAKADYLARALQQQAQQTLPQVKKQAQMLVMQYYQEVASWGQAHLYHDSYDGHSYPLDSGYMKQGIGALLDKDLSEARTTADFAAVVGETQHELFNFHTMEADYTDHTPYNQAHASDLSMLKQYQLQQGTVVVISLVEQAMRVYQQGKLVHSALITSGLASLPSLPGVWKTLDRQAPTNFLSSEPPGSPYWFPPTPINYAILYHLGGFFLHDAWWRGSFGPGTQFPHRDDGGNTPYNYDGSHGCINLSEADAAWLYHHTDFNTTIVLY